MDVTVDKKLVSFVCLKPGGLSSLRLPVPGDGGTIRSPRNDVRRIGQKGQTAYATRVVSVDGAVQLRLHGIIIPEGVNPSHTGPAFRQLTTQRD